MPMGEFKIIARYFAPLATDPGAFGLLDDAAAITPPPGRDLVVTTDTLVATIHFLADDPADTIARKALRVNLSDLAAKGAEPIGYLLSLALPENWSKAWLERFALGLKEDQNIFGLSLLGGDTVRTPGPLTISITAFGSVATGGIIRRGSGKVGDYLYVSGTIGDAALGLHVRQGNKIAAGWILTDQLKSDLQRRYLVPEPRLALVPALAGAASAAMDISDGLVGDLAKMLQSEGIGAEIAFDAIPLSTGAAKIVSQDPEALSLILGGGDDYEILAAIPPEKTKDFEGAAELAGVTVSRIGRLVENGGSVVVADANGGKLKVMQPSYAHF